MELKITVGAQGADKIMRGLQLPSPLLSRLWHWRFFHGAADYDKWHR